MIRSSSLSYALILLVLIILLSGCELARTDGAESDLQPVSEIPPTLAPLGADSAEPAGEATAIPTVINVQPDEATSATVAEAEQAGGGNELNLPDESDAVAGVAAESLTGPAAEPAAQESIVVDAQTDDLATGGPVAANPPASQTDPATYGGASYTVQPGDTLFSIGLAYGVTAQEIMLANGLVSDVIQAGQTLTIPAGGEVSSDYAAPAYEAPADETPAYEPPAAGGNGHLVRPGETLYRIALNYGTSVDAIAGANGIPYPYVIQVGQQLVIPAAGEYYAPPPPAGGYYQEPDPGYYQQPPEQNYYPQGPDSDYYQPPANDYAAPPSGIAGTHTVAPGETLFIIAQRYGITTEILAGANGLVNPNQIYVGQVLYLP